MSNDLLLEIGTEEIPSDYLENGLKELKNLSESFFKENRIHYETFHTYGTPRRLILISKGIADTQDDMVQEITGPPKKAAYDAQGNPTKAALGFAQKYGVPVDTLGCIETPRGEYLHVKVHVTGRPTKAILSESLPILISRIPWPKTMRWGSINIPFVRPIHWILALLGEEIIPFEMAGIKSNNKTMGHRFLGSREMDIKNLQDYLLKIKQSVMIDPEERKKAIEKAVIAKTGDLSGTPLIDPELLTTVANLVEFPSVVCGSFDQAFLALPAPVLITAMKKHQKYFAVNGPDGRLIPYFVAVNNTRAKDESVVQKGHERVLRARLSDADFFFHEDRKTRLEDRLEELKGVIYQADLGTSFGKVERFTHLAEYLGSTIAPEKIDSIKLAAGLSKCDLVTHMVGEFPSLQGVMGREYAFLDGHPEEVCLAIQEHYLPVKAGDELPSSTIGAIVGLADRMDTIAGFFAIGMEPTGAADPFALRRHALAIIRILEKTEWDVSLRDFISTSLDLFTGHIDFDKDQASDSILAFFQERYKQMMLRSDYRSDLIEAVISATFDRIGDLRYRIEQLNQFVDESKEFEPLATTFKRISNILKNQEGSLTVDPIFFTEPCESRLWDAYQAMKDDVSQLMQKRQYLKALNTIAGLRKPVDDFFQGVEILTKESPELKNNRVAILQHLSRLFLNLADLSKFSI
ncbi:MAG: glycine--tRNA ligase subunit beta [Deltaproteobacteria bacterium]|nr:glycine--tRNA ligase subunit beta [Deltaproteobacteria bacterium]